AGFALREGSNARIERCDIRRNSWDGIAMYRGARAEIMDNVVDGVDKAAGSAVGGGRGVGIGLTWDAQAIVHHNLVRRYWKGIGVFVNADAAVSENIVEDILTWGITLWAPDSGTATARIERNIVYRTGACGVMVDRRAASATPGALVDNVVIRTGQNARYDNGTPYCWQRPIARPSVPSAFVQSGNLLWDNRQPADAGDAPPPMPQLAEATLIQRVRPLAASLAALPAFRETLVFRELPQLLR
ncbi:MAG TPA: right-handed parallel beta-helix repeat-containing protein, partial [Longimicrobiales bacterium]|nr:right-handed parallel beta-helix repeat-containing protein [Longimicrobiales bacterium]